MYLHGIGIGNTCTSVDSNVFPSAFSMQEWIAALGHLCADRMQCMLMSNSTFDNMSVQYQCHLRTGIVGLGIGSRSQNFKNLSAGHINPNASDNLWPFSPFHRLAWPNWLSPTLLCVFWLTLSKNHHHPYLYYFCWSSLPYCQDTSR